MKHLVQYSLGVSSGEVAWRLVEMYGPDNVTLLTADTRKEDEDNWRFGRQVAEHLGCEITVTADGRTPMQVGRDHRVVPNNRMAVCSRVLKRELLRSWINEHCDPADTVIYLGYDWTEPHRLAAALPHWEPYQVKAPLMDPPHLWKHQIEDLFRVRGIDPPRLYALGYEHSNCGGCCVRGGQAQWELTLRVFPDRYREWEAEEEETRTLLGKDVAILRDRTGGTVKPLPLRAFRERLESQPGLFEADDWGACGCALNDNEQRREVSR